MKRFFKEGDKGPQVEIIQQRLAKLGFYEAKIDGDFGPITGVAVKEFQISAKLNADGVVGPITRKALELATIPFPKGAIAVPNGQDELYETFGDPLDSGYWKEYSGFCEVPEELGHCFTYKKGDKHGFYCNKMLIPTFQKVFQSIVDGGLAEHMKTFEGCYNLRKVRGGRKLSTHSWGIAIDLNASENWMGAEPKMHPGIVSVFENYGFVWGGRFRRKDGMHFQYVKGY